MSVIIWPNIFFVQYFTLVLTGVATIILVGYKLPFRNLVRNKAEILLEVTTIVISYHVFCFTDWLPDLVVRHWLGYSIIICVMGQLLISLILFAICKIKRDCASYKRKKILKKAKKQAHSKYKVTFANGVKKIIERRKNRHKNSMHAKFKIYVGSKDDKN